MRTLVLLTAWEVNTTHMQAHTHTHIHTHMHTLTHTCMHTVLVIFLWFQGIKFHYGGAKAVPLTEDQVFKYMSLWGPFLFHIPLLAPPP